MKNKEIFLGNLLLIYFYKNENFYKNIFIEKKSFMILMKF